MKIHTTLQKLIVCTLMLIASFQAKAQYTVASGLSITSITTSSMNISWTNGTGVGRLVVMRASPSSAVLPVDFTNYSASSVFGSGSNLGSANYVVLKGSATSVNVTGLAAGTYYYVRIYEYGGTSTSPDFMLSPYASVADYTLSTQPTTPPSGLTVTGIGSSGATISWTAGSGTNTFSTIRQSTTNTNLPVDGTNYYTSTSFGLGDPLGVSAPYSYAMYELNGTTYSPSALLAATDYRVAAFTYNGTTSGTQNYLTTSYPTVGFTTLATQPTNTVNSVAVTDITDDAFTLSWLNASSGGGTNHLVLISDNSALDVPIDMSIYTANTNYGSGSLIGNSYVVYNGTGNALRITGLDMETQYFVRIFDFNGSTGTYNNTTNYYTSSYGYISRTTNTTTPAAASTGLSFSGITATSFTANWTAGGGQKRLAQVKPGRIQTALVFDGTNDYVGIPYNAALQPTSAMTLDMWVFRANWSNSATYQCYAGNSELGGYALIHSGTTLTGFVYRNGNWGSPGASVAHLTPGWHHLALTYDGRYTTIYVDGAAYGQNDAGANYPITYAYNNSLFIGAEAGTGTSPSGSYSNAAIDEVRLWNTAQPSYTIAYYSSRSLVGNESNLVGLWRLNDGSATTSTVSNGVLASSGSLNGTMYNMTTTAASGFVTSSGWAYSNSPCNAPVDMASYNLFSSNFSNPGSVVGTGYHVVNNGNISSITVSGLSPGTFYNFIVYEYDESSGTFYNYMHLPMLTGDVQTLTASVPTITGVSPISGPVGTAVTITGTGFSTTASNNIVSFGATRATVNSATATTLNVTVPFGANFAPVSVQVTGQVATYSREFIVTSQCAGTLTAGTFTNTTQACYTNNYCVDLKDINPDNGKTDIVAAGYGSSFLYGFWGTATNGGTPTFSTSGGYSTQLNPFSLELVDIDMDGKLDVISTALGTGQLSVQRAYNPSISSPAMAYPLSANPAEVKSGDIDGDGKPDIVIGYGSGTVISVYRNTSSIANIQLAARTDITVGSVSPIALVVRDFDGDGKADIAFSHGNASNFSVLRSTSSPGTITFAAQQNFSTVSGNVVDLATGDFNYPNPDGKPDMAVACSNNFVRIFNNTSTVGNISFTTSTTLTTFAGTPNSVAVNDLDGDAHPDVIVGYSASNNVSLFEATGNFGFAPRVDIATTGSSSYNVYSGDLNMDGRSDIVSTTGGTTFNILTNGLNPLASEPITPASNLTFTNVAQTSMTLNFTAGSGSDRIVLARQGLSISATPADGTGYTANSTFGSGSDLGGGTYVVYSGNSNTCNITGLQSNTNYYFAVYEFNGSSCNTNYLLGTPATGVSATLNTPPVINAIANPAAICMNSGQQTIPLSGIGSGSVNETQTLTVTATSSNTGLIPNPTVSYISPSAVGSLSYTPVASQSGTSIITVTVNDGGLNNNITTQTFTVTVTSAPTTANAGPDQQICISTATLAANTPVVGTGTWSIAYTSNVAITTGNIGNVNSPNTTLNGLNAGDTVTMRWTISSGTCTPSQDLMGIRRSTCPLSSGFTWSPSTLCATPLGVNNINFTDASYSPSSTITSWNWTFAGPITPNPSSSTQQNPANVQFVGPGTFTVTLVINDNVGGNSSLQQVITVNPFPAAAGTITGLTTVCQGQTSVTYSVSPVANANPNGYIWSLPAGATISSGSGTNSITVNYDNTASSGQVQVLPTNSCGAGSASPVLNVTVNPLPGIAGTITGTATVCQGQNGVVFSVPSISNATTYNWVVPSGATIVSGNNTNSITVDFGTTAVSGTVTVTGANSCGTGTISPSFPVTVNPLPAAASPITGPNFIDICPIVTGATYSTGVISNATNYLWSLPSGATIVSGAGTGTITVDFVPTASAGQVWVIGQNACGSGDTAFMNINVGSVAPVPICMVTVDTNSNYNQVIWEKPLTGDLDSFRIYREITSNNYLYVGATDYDSLSVFVDSVYVPLADPNVTNYRYKITAVDTCGNESVMSPHHGTIFLQAGPGVGNSVLLNWTFYEGATVDYYDIMRDSTGLGQWEQIGQVPGTNQNFTDVAPPLSVSVVNIRYKLRSNWQVICNPTRNINTTESNLKDIPPAIFIGTPDYVDANMIGLYPNPTQGLLQIDMPTKGDGCVLQLRNTIGQVVYSEQLGKQNQVSGRNRYTLDLSTVAKGVYTVTFDFGNSQVHKKLVIQ